MIAIETYAELCALMAETGGDEAKEVAIAAEHGVSADDWRASKSGYTAQMSDPKDMGKTAIAFMPLYQAAQAKARGGKEPCTLEVYGKVHAEMANRKGPDGQKLHFMIVLAENQMPYTLWLECEGYWTPQVGGSTILGQPNPKFNPQKAAEFGAIVQREADRVNGITDRR